MKENASWWTCGWWRSVGEAPAIAMNGVEEKEPGGATCVSACFVGSVGFSHFGSLVNSSSHCSWHHRCAAKDSQVICVQMSVLKSAQLDSFRYRPSFPEQPNPSPSSHTFLSARSHKTCSSFTPGQYCTGAIPWRGGRQVGGPELQCGFFSELGQLAVNVWWARYILDLLANSLKLLQWLLLSLQKLLHSCKMISWPPSEPCNLTSSHPSNWWSPNPSSGSSES